ncbi:4-hydroxybenzoate 3-monooxygenase [Nesterenkonia flava]|uniref:4-hydroxybenzoate 3-monooxygenase n=1 Tax=Nesterenkonia flava TaxID=469799 RepID=A0ABU1FPK6_9MICC|nr:4-hydroxybenzoate 3-monooxygenase [Nesterenkonia flava]MDR5710579.1 4-hydroxybenzoate 3-monooxygenase [Nesterenkonia flava]
MHTYSTQVGIIGGGPAGLLLSHLLHLSGVESVVCEARDEETIATTHRAGILEQASVELLRTAGLSHAVEANSHEHRGVYLRFSGRSHHLDFTELVGATVSLYAQNQLFTDLAEQRRRDGGTVLYETTVSDVQGLQETRPVIHARTVNGEEVRVECDFVIGADGSRSVARTLMPAAAEHRHSYPYAWFGFLVEAPPSADELIYTHSPQGFALVSQRSDTVQRMYFQCDPSENADEWSEDRIWSEMHARLAGDDDFALKTGPIISTTVLPFRSYVREPLRHGRLFLAGDAAHTVPPTGAKGLNLALHDAKILHEGLESFYRGGGSQGLESYSERALRRMWRVQSFSYWLTTLMHNPPGQDEFSNRRAAAELEAITSMGSGRRYLAESYTGWPHETW